MVKCSYAQAHGMAKKKVGKPYHTHEWQYECSIDGIIQIKVTIPDPHGKNTDLLRQGTLKSIIKQLNLTQDEFLLWRDCTMSEEEYKDLMRERLSFHTVA